MSNREKFDWDHRIKYLLKESCHPKTHDNYKDVVSFGLKRAKEFLEELGDHVPLYSSST